MYYACKGTLKDTMCYTNVKGPGKWEKEKSRVKWFSNVKQTCPCYPTKSFNDALYTMLLIIDFLVFQFSCNFHNKDISLFCHFTITTSL